MSSTTQALQTTKDGALPSEEEQQILRKALLSRVVEERLLTLYQHGKLNGTVHTCIGQEFSGAVVTSFLQPGDAVFSNHRCHGHFLSFTGDAHGLIAEIMGKETGVCGGRGGSQHLCKDGFYSNGVQGGIVPVAAGLALARKLRGAPHLAVVFIGDGTLGEGVVYETFNLAAKWEVPLLVVLENNGYAQSTSQAETLAGDISARAAAFGIRTARGDTWNWQGLYATTQALVETVRSEGRPAFLQIDTFRLKAHSKGDDYRPRSEVEPYERRDPLNVLKATEPTVYQALLADVALEVEAAVEAADAAAYARPTAGEPMAGQAPLTWEVAVVERQRVGQAINQVLTELMAGHPHMVFFGEDVKAPYGGAFKVSEGLSDRFPDRVWNTPISEAAVVGLGCGLAMEGYQPFVEIMFGDFMGLAFDQVLNHASKFRYMYNEQVRANVVIRTPMGGGRGYGPTHSQTLDRHFLGIPGLRVVAVNNLIAPRRVYASLLTETKDPTLVIENKGLYGLPLRDQLPQGYQTWLSDEPYPTVHVRPQAASIDLTLIGYGGLSETLLQVADRLFEAHDLIAQIICPTQIYPFSIRPLLPLLAVSRALVVVEEGQGFAGFGTEVIAQWAEHNEGQEIRVKRIVPPPTPIPASGPAEKAMLPGVDGIVASILEWIHEA